MPSRFVHLHVHSHYSLLQALPQLDELVAATKKAGMDAVALTDYGAVYGVIEFIQECQKKEIKPIIGQCTNLALDKHTDKRPRIDDKTHQLVLLCETEEGYRNLLKLTTIAHLEGFYYKPRIDKDLLRTHHRGLIALSGGKRGDICKALAMDEFGKAEELVKEYVEIFGEGNFFLELQDHPELDEQVARNRDLLKLSKATGVPVVATKDVHYLTRAESEAHDVLRCIGDGKNLDDDRRSRMTDADYSFVSAEHMEKAFADVPEAIENTRRIADRCNVKLELGKWNFADIAIPEGETYESQLRKLVYEGIARKVPDITQEVKDRLEYELNIICNKGYSPYFLVVSDYMRWAKDHGIMTTTRGSAAGSLVSYAIDIVPVNPLDYKLPFERFLNPFRPSPPDIDGDFEDTRRDEVIAYVTEKYGRDRVAQIGTFGTMAARGSVRDVGRVLGLPYALCDRISKMIPMGSQGFPMTIARAIDMTLDLREEIDKDPQVKRLLELAQRVEGSARHVSVHAAGVVIAPRPLTEYTALQKESGGEKLITQYEMNSIEAAGVLKSDFLGIRNLSILGTAVKIIKRTKNVDIDITNIPLDDAKTYKMLADGETTGTFQLNGAGMTRYLKELKPSSIHDIMAMVALFRPGPMDSIPEYIRRKHNPSLVSYLDPRLEPILDKSYGIMTYQDDVLLTAIHIAGYNWEEADKLRKAMGKKIPEEMAKQEEKFLKGCVKNGTTDAMARQLWELIKPFAAYGFNKCLAGDTKVMDPKEGTYRTIRELYEAGATGTVVALGKDLVLRSEPRLPVVQNGVKPVFELTTRLGKRIRATENHPFLTTDGWMRLDRLQKGFCIAVARRIPDVGETVACGMKADVPYIARMEMALPEVGFAQLARGVGPSSRFFARDHKRTGFLQPGNIPESDVYWDEIVSITAKGKEMTYDLEVPGSHNFVANDIVVHNSHAAAYGMVAYQTSYLKANWPSEYMTAVLSAESDDADTVATVVADCKKMGINVLPPDVQESGSDFTYIDDTNIRFGLLAIKNLGSDIAAAIIEERVARGKFKDIADLASRVGSKNFNKKSLEALIKTGALDSLGERNYLLAGVEQILAYHKDAVKDLLSGQNNLFASSSANAPARGELKLRAVPPATKREKLAWERELLGLYVSEHPFKEYADFFGESLTTVAELPQKKGLGLAPVAGIIMDIRIIFTKKKNEPMAFVKLEDMTGTIEVVVFPRTYKENLSALIKDTAVLVEGKVEEKDGEMKVLAEKLTVLTSDSITSTRQMLSYAKRDFVPPSATLLAEKSHICVAVPSKMAPSLANELKRVFSENPGSRKVFLLVKDKENPHKIETSFSIAFSGDTIAEIEKIVGRGAVQE